MLVGKRDPCRISRTSAIGSERANSSARANGVFSLRSSAIRISLRGDHTLVASNPGEPDVELIPKRGTTFDMKGQNGVTIEFKQDASGKVNEAALDDNGTAVVLKRK